MPRKKKSEVEQPVVESEVILSDEFIMLKTTEGEYELKAVAVDGKAIAALLKDGLEIYKEEFSETEAWEGGQIRVEIEPRELAVIKLLEAYHQESGDLMSGNITTISRHLIHPHPFNRERYGRYENSDRPDLRELLDREDSRIVEPLVVLPSGLILSGNGRYQATDKNDKFLDLPVRVEEEMDLNEQALFLVLANQYRPNKTEEQKRGELLTIASAVFSGRSAQPKQKGLTANEILNQYAGKENPVSRQTSYNLATVTKGLETIQSPGLKTAIKALNDRVSIEKAAFVAKTATEPVDEVAAKLGISSEEVAAKAAEKMLKGSKGHATKIIEESLNELKAEKLSQSNPETISLYSKAIALGDKPSDNRHTPREIIDWASSTMGGIDVDAFATLYQPFYVGAATAFTIETNFFEGKNALNPGSKVFANPPYSEGTKCCVVFDQLLRQGIVSELFLVIPQHILGSASFNQMLREHNGLVYQPGVRLEFEPGEFLLEWAAKEGKTVGNDANREVTVIVYFGSNRKKFADEAPLSLKGMVLEKFTSKKGEMDIAKLSQKIASWRDNPGFDFYGNKLEINEQGPLVDGEVVTLSAEETAKAIAIYAAIMQSFF